MADPYPQPTSARKPDACSLMPIAVRKGPSLLHSALTSEHGAVKTTFVRFVSPLRGGLALVPFVSERANERRRAHA